MFAGTEVTNAARTTAYASTLLPHVEMTDCYGCERLGVALADPPYVDPITDEAPWYDPDYPETGQFLGMYPLTMKSFTDATTTADVGQSIYDGGFIAPPRRATREMRVTGALLGTTHAGVEAGFTWLKSILSGSECGSCNGDEVCFMAHCPDIDETSTPDEVDAAFGRASRHLRSVTVTEGPTVLSETPFKRGGYLMTVEFIMTAAVPYIYTDLEPIASAAGTSLSVHKSGAAIFATDTIPEVPPPPPPTLIRDIECPIIPAAPTPPAIPGACGTVPSAFFSYAIYIPETAVVNSRDGVISQSVTTGRRSVRHLRARLLPRPLPGQQPEDLDPSTTCGQFVINFIPSGTKVTLDGMTEQIIYQVGANRPTRGEHLVSGIGTELFSWPILSCGLGYYLLIDVDTDVLVNADLSISSRE
jgi:hypothetical protein